MAVKEKHIKLYKDIVMSLAEMSHDARLKVGALLLKDGRIVATGYNGQMTGQPHKQLVFEGHDVSTIHAEMNCLMFAAKHGIGIEGCEIFVSHFPCMHCTKHLHQAGISKIYYVEDYRVEDNLFKYAIPMEKVE